MTFSLSELIKLIKVNQVAHATYAIREHWYITKNDGNEIRYCDSIGRQDESSFGIVKLTRSNMDASYEIIG